ncbi:hypothetical protein JK386_04925 [Nocardioides sp. zg-536]|uniref:Uncharacterized protein n=1 Tax=Nocardioides faecalis TaxID=2803858 RepID=A0A939BUU1_9ACTN|nr:hypothetical protein [Nocardioides faecalis]MBM9459236.1 hypothetical protein [Nocardioides faecalis]QVI59629.1 hypothetical protein KG111_04590 [Nocardioides faecalis]
MTASSDARDAGQLIAYALRPKARPGADGDYGRLVGRYLDETIFRSLVEGFLDGMNLRVLHAGDLGLVLTSRRESIFAYRLSGEAATWTKDKARVLRGLAHLGIAAYAYPHPDDLHDPSVRYVDVLPCEDFIRRSCTQLRERGEKVAQDASGAGDHIVDLSLAAGVDTAWSEWDQMPATDVGGKGRGAGRVSTKCTAYWVYRALQDLVDHGLARPVGKDGDGRFQLLERYRHQVASSAALEGYQALAALARVDEKLPDQRDPDARWPVPGRPPSFVDPASTPGGTTGSTGSTATDLPATAPAPVPAAGAAGEEDA